MNGIPVYKVRKPWLAGLLTLLAPGLGQLYNGQSAKAVSFFLLSFSLLFAAVHLFQTFVGMCLSVGLVLAYMAVVMWDAARLAARQREYVLKWFNRGWLYAFLIGLNALGGGLVEMYLSMAAYESFYVPSESMEPTLVPGDRFMGAVLAEDEEPRIGEVIVFHPPSMDDVHFVKRVVAVPGDVVSVKRGRVHVNGRFVQSGESVFDHVRGTRLKDVDRRHLAEDEYWVMGDNRPHSWDSRFFGPVRRNRIGHRALYIYWAAESADGRWLERFGVPLEK